MEVQRKKVAAVGGKTVEAETLGEREADWVEAQDPSRRREVRFAEKEEVAVQKRQTAVER